MSMYGKGETIIEALRECEEYFDDRSDADHDDTGFVPNKEMALLSTVRAAIAEIPAYKHRIRCWVVLGDAGGKRAFVTEEEARLVAGDWAKVIPMIEDCT